MATKIQITASSSDQVKRILRMLRPATNKGRLRVRIKEVDGRTICWIRIEDDCSP